jgi:hypothetical protein
MNSKNSKRLSCICSPPSRSVCFTEMTIEPEDVLLQLTSTAPAACCPRCVVPSSSVHSRYQRHLTDLPWGTRPVRLQLTARKFVCRNPTCRRRLFTARVPELVAAYARKTQRLITALQAIGVALSRQAHGSRIASDCPPVGTRCCGWCAVCPLPVVPPLSAIGSMTGPTGSASATGRLSWI